MATAAAADSTATAGALIRARRRDVLDLERQHVDRARQACASRRASSSSPSTNGATCAPGASALAIEQAAIDAERITGERQHAAELAGADDAYLLRSSIAAASAMRRRRRS